MADLALITAGLIGKVEVAESRTYPAGVALSVGDAVRQAAAAGGGWLAALATTAANSLMVAVNIGTTNSAINEPVHGLVKGWLHGFDVSGMTPGAFVYLSDTSKKLADAPGTLNIKVGTVVLAAHDQLVGGSPTKIIRFDSRMTWLGLGAIPAGGIGAAVLGVASGYKLARGVHTTLDADDTVVTGLTTVVAAVASFHDAPVEAAKFVSCTIGDQAGAPAAGSIQIKTHKDTDADAAIIDATTFTIKIDWIAIGT